jgi:hypothetical protein
VAGGEEITDLVNQLAPSLLTVSGCGALTAAKILGETAGIGRLNPAMPTPGTTHRSAAGLVVQPDRNPAFVFPEMQHTGYVAAAWVPQSADYLSLAFWTATAVSPTDISAIRPWAKLLMMLEAGRSFALAVLVIGYAVNIL